MLALKDVHWLAGLLEGEGFFGLRRGKDLVVQVSMTDKDVIHRVMSVLPFGTLDKERLLPSGKTAYGWRVSSQKNAAGLMMTLLPLMGGRRAEKIRHCLAEWKTKPLPQITWTHCKNGHELSGVNLKIITEGKYKKRRCIECAKLRQRKYRVKAKLKCSSS